MKFEFDDALLIIGCGLVALGVFLWNVPAGFVVLGFELVGFAYLIRAEKANAITE